MERMRALVTGGATGIGRATVLHLARAGFDVALNYRSSAQAARKTAAEAEKSGGGPIIYGDPNRGEGHRVHIAHVGSARKNLTWAKELGIA